MKKKKEAQEGKKSMGSEIKSTGTKETEFEHSYVLENFDKADLKEKKEEASEAEEATEAEREEYWYIG